MSWALCKQLLKEFALPAIVASGWVIYGQWSDPSGATLSASVNRFGAAFFFTAWLTSQLFRVLKQARTEKSFNNLETRLTGLVGDLARESNELRNVATGGDAFAYISIGLGALQSPTIFVSHSGVHPLYGVSARMVDLQLFGTIPPPITLAAIATAENLIDVGDMTPGFGRLIGTAEPFVGPAQDYNIFFTARNGGWTQMYRARLIDNVWVSASCVCRDLHGLGHGTVLHAERDAGFPETELPAPWPDHGVVVRGTAAL